MKNILFILLSFCLAGEMEVDGNLKVTGIVDASGNPITNVGAALSMTDAINGNVLQSALRDDGVYEYKIIATKIDHNWLHSDNNGNGFQVSYKQISDPHWQSGFESFLNGLIIDGWKIHQVDPYLWEGSGYGSFYWNQYILKRPLADD